MANQMYPSVRGFVLKLPLFGGVNEVAFCVHWEKGDWKIAQKKDGASDDDSILITH